MPMTLDDFKAGLANGTIDSGQYLSSDDQRGQSPFWQYGPGGANPVDPGIIAQYRQQQAAAVPGFDQATLQGYQSNLGSDSANGYKSFNQGLMAVNPQTGQQERVYSVNSLGEDGNPNSGASRYYFESDPNRPQNAQATMAGGYSSGNDKNSIVQPAVMGGLAAIAGGAALGAMGGGASPAAVGGTAPAGAVTGSAAAGGGGATGGGSGLLAGAGTGEVMGTGGALSGGAFSSAGGSGLALGGGAAGAGLSVTPEMSLATGFGGATGAAGAGAATGGGSTIGSIIGALGGAGNIGNTALTLYGLNSLSNSYRSLADAQKNSSSLDQAQRAPYQANLSQLVNNPQQYLSTDPFATSLAAMYKNNIIPRQTAQSGNPASVLDTAGSQFVNSIAGNYNQQVGNLSGIAGFGFPQSPYAGYQAGQLGAGGAMANFGSLQSLGNLFGNNMSGVKIQGQSGSSGPFNSTVV